MGETGQKDELSLLSSPGAWVESSPTGTLCVVEISSQTFFLGLRTELPRSLSKFGVSNTLATEETSGEETFSYAEEPGYLYPLKELVVGY